MIVRKLREQRLEPILGVSPRPEQREQILVLVAVVQREIVLHGIRNLFRDVSRDVLSGSKHSQGTANAALPEMVLADVLDRVGQKSQRRRHDLFPGDRPERR
jgi:hypothetical protein